MAFSSLRGKRRSNAGHDDVEAQKFTIVHTTTTPMSSSSLQHSLLNTPANLKFEDLGGDRNPHLSNNLIDPALMHGSGLHHPHELPTFRKPLSKLKTVRSSLTLGSNVPEVEPASASACSEEVSPYRRRRSRIERWTESTYGPRATRSNGVRAGQNSGPEQGQNLADPQNPEADLAQPALFCCPHLVEVVKPSNLCYQHSIHFLKTELLKPSHGIPLYPSSPRHAPMPKVNPDLRIPMLLLTGARVFKVEKHSQEGEISTRYFVRDITSDPRKFWEVLPGGIVDKLGWREVLDNGSFAENCYSEWKCRHADKEGGEKDSDDEYEEEGHNDRWTFRIMEKLFDNDDDSSAHYGYGSSRCSISSATPTASSGTTTVSAGSRRESEVEQYGNTAVGMGHLEPEPQGGMPADGILNNGILKAPNVPDASFDATPTIVEPSNNGLGGASFFDNPAFLESHDYMGPRTMEEFQVLDDDTFMKEITMFEEYDADESA